nr:diaminobutyrate acetyltransferase [Spiractinospora alimapuensis]
MPDERSVAAGVTPELTVETPRLEDGKALWALAASCGLDVNSPYAYTLWCRDFSETSVVSRDQTGEVRGFVTGYVRPRAADTYFLWQVGVDQHVRGHRLARRMLDHVGRICASLGVRYVEATVTPDNTASRALFASFARDNGCDPQWSALFEREHFPTESGGHEREELVRIGPLSAPLASS